MMKLYDFNEVSFVSVLVKGIEFLFSDVRLKPETIPANLPYVYDVRDNDDCSGLPSQVKPYVMVNYWGTIVGTEPVPFDEDGECWLDDEFDWDYGEKISADEYLARKGVSV